MRLDAGAIWIVRAIWLAAEWLVWPMSGGPPQSTIASRPRAMPANLSPEYKDAQEKFRRAREPQEKLECLREMLRTIPKHKGRSTCRPRSRLASRS